MGVRSISEWNFSVNAIRKVEIPQGDAIEQVRQWRQGKFHNSLLTEQCLTEGNRVKYITREYNKIIRCLKVSRIIASSRLKYCYRSACACAFSVFTSFYTK